MTSVDHKKLIVYVYAMVNVRAAEDRVTRQSFGYSKTLGKPVSSTEYHWEAQVDGRTVATNATRALKDLSCNFSANYMNGMGGKYVRGTYTTEFAFALPDNIQMGDAATPRLLTAGEQRDFLRDFQSFNTETLAQARAGPERKAPYA